MMESADFVSSPNHLPRPPRRPWRWQWNILTLLLLMAAVSVWVTRWRLDAETREMKAELGPLRTLARELVVSDPQQYAIVEQREQWYNDDSWELYLPPGDQYSLRLATRQIDARDFPATEHAAGLQPGKHVVTLQRSTDDQHETVRVIVDGETALKVGEDAGWDPGHGSSSSGLYTQSKQQPVDEPLVLKRLRFMVQQAEGRSHTPQEPSSGLLLWIESDGPD